MRIAFDTFNLGIIPPSGSKTYTIELIRALADLDTPDEWQVITYQRKKKYYQELFKNRNNLFIKNCIPHPLSLGRQLSPLIKIVSSFCEKNAARQCDLFHCTNQTYFPMTFPNIVTTIHDMIPLRDEPFAPGMNTPVFRKNLDAVIGRSTALFASSEFTRTEIIHFYPEAQSKTIVIPLAVGSRFTTLQCDRSFLSRYGIGDDARPYLLFVGQIRSRKNVLPMIKVFESLDNRLSDFNLVIIGQVSDGSYPDEVFRHAAQSRQRDRIIFLHNVSDDDLVRFYNHACAMIYFSFFEGFGLPIIEAMACGCPVACSRSSSMTEIAEGAAIMVDPYDFDSMRNGMLEICENQTLRNALRKKGLDRAAGYSWKRTAELTYNGYKKAIGG